MSITSIIQTNFLRQEIKINQNENEILGFHVADLSRSTDACFSLFVMKQNSDGHWVDINNLE